MELADDRKGNEFLRKLVQLMLDETALVGNGPFMKANHPKLFDFKQPRVLEVSNLLLEN